MQIEPQSSIARLVAHHGGATAFSRLLGGQPVYQEIQRWLNRGWASPKHLFAIEPHLIDGVTLRDLDQDRLTAKAAEASAATA